MDNQLLKETAAWAIRFAAAMLKMAWVVAARIIAYTLAALPIAAAVWTVAPDLAKVTVFIAAYVLCMLDRAHWMEITEETPGAEAAGQFAGLVLGVATGVWAAYWFYWLFFPLAVAIAVYIVRGGA